jgi:hypothetical protein
MELADLIRDERTLTVRVAAGELEITYRPSAFTAAAEEKYLDAIENKRVNLAYAQALSEILTGWDLTRDGEPVPITLDELKHLPAEFLAEVFLAIVQDNRMGGKETRKNSGGGSRPAGK